MTTGSQPEPKQRALIFSNSRVVSSGRAARMLGCSTKKVQRLIESGLVVGFRAFVGAQWQVEYDSIVAYSQRLCKGQSVSCERAARMLNYSSRKVVRLIARGILKGSKPHPRAQWQVEYDSIVDHLIRLHTEPPQ